MIRGWQAAKLSDNEFLILDGCFDEHRVENEVPQFLAVLCRCSDGSQQQCWKKQDEQTSPQGRS